MSSREVIAVVLAIWSIPLLAVAVHWWRNSVRIAEARADDFHDDGFWTAFPWPWQRTPYGVRFGAAGLFASAGVLIVVAVLELFGIGPTLP